MVDDDDNDSMSTTIQGTERIIVDCKCTCKMDVKGDGYIRFTIVFSSLREIYYAIAKWREEEEDTNSHCNWIAFGIQKIGLNCNCICSVTHKISSTAGEREAGRGRERERGFHKQVRVSNTKDFDATESAKREIGRNVETKSLALSEHWLKLTGLRRVLVLPQWDGSFYDQDRLKKSESSKWLIVLKRAHETNTTA